MAKGSGGGGRAARSGRDEVRLMRAGGGDRTVAALTSGSFSVDRIVNDNPARSSYGGTGQRQAAERAYNQAAREIGARRAVGQSTPRLTEVRRQIRRQYGLAR